tara:strand:+ start:98 stop:814 length:717 start_codon:yes stop_codon:yes gene_type:complete
MPNKTLTAPGDTVAKNILKSGNNYNTVHDATAGTNAGNADNKFTLNAKSGSNYFIRRGIIVYDFRQSPLPQGVKVIRAQLILNDVIESAAQTGGDKIRVAWLSNPNTFGGMHKNDYSKARYADNSYTSAQQLNNGADGAIINLDNRLLLNRLQIAINQKTLLHLVVRNELDYQDTQATGMNRVFFDRPTGDDNPMQIRIFYRINNIRRNPGGRGAGGVASSGFGGVDMFCGTNSGFGN